MNSPVQPDNMAAPAIKDVTTESFVRDVIDASQGALVLVDFWAGWCGPCKQLKPVLEKIVRESGGAVHLAKIDIDKFPEIASQMRVQSVPTVYAFKDGQPVDAFTGALPESEIRRFIEKNLGASLESPVEAALQQAQEAFDAEDYRAASELYAAVQSQDPENVPAIAGLAKCLVATGDVEEARAMLENLSPSQKADKAIVQLMAEIDLLEKGETAGDLDELQQQLEKEPENRQLRYDYALALGLKGKKEEAARQLLQIIRDDAQWNEEAARKQLLQFFDLWGKQDPATLMARKKLASLLF